jgi:histidine ammonia-lyase
MKHISLDGPLSWTEIAAVASGSVLELSPAATSRIHAAHLIVCRMVDDSIRAYGVNTGVGALSDTVIPREQQALLSRRILLSHAVGVGPALPTAETRAIMAAMVNNFARGYSGIRPCVVQRIVDLLNAGCTPRVPEQGSVGYITHGAQIGLALIGLGTIEMKGEQLPASAALARLNLEPLVLQAKEGLCLVNGTPCVTGLGCLVMHRARHVMNWADAVGAMTFETQRGQLRAFDPAVMSLRLSPGLREVASKLNRILEGSQILAAAAGRRTQDALSLRAIPQVHGAVRDVWSAAATTVDQELGSVTDNPVVAGRPESPQIYSQANPLGAGIGLAMDQMATAMASLGGISGSRLERMVNPLISGLPAFLAEPGGSASGFMIAQYTAVSLIGENRRLAAPATLDGGSTSALQEDILCHATPAALKALKIIDNVRNLIAIEYLAASQSYDLLDLKALSPAPRSFALYRALREVVGPYADDRPLGEDIESAARFMFSHAAQEILERAGRRDGADVARPDV